MSMTTYYSAATTVATPSREFSVSRRQQLRQNVTKVSKYFGCFSINHQQLYFVWTDEFIQEHHRRVLIILNENTANLQKKLWTSCFSRLFRKSTYAMLQITAAQYGNTRSTHTWFIDVTTGRCVINVDKTHTAPAQWHAANVAVVGTMAQRCRRAMTRQCGWALNRCRCLVVSINCDRWLVFTSIKLAKKHIMYRKSW